MKILDEAKSAGTSLHTATRRAEELQEQMTAGLMEMNGILDGLYDAIIANVRSRVDAGVSGDDAPNGDNILERWAFLDGLFDAMAGAELSVWQGRDKSGEEAAAFFADIGTVMRESGDGLAAFLASGVVTDPGVVDQYNILSGQLSRFSGLLAEFSAEWARGESFSAALAASTDNLLNLFDELDVETSGLAVGSVENANARTTDVEAIVSSSILTSLVILVASTVAGVILALFITRGIVNPINAVIRSLSQSEAVIEAAAGKIDVASHDLSEGVTSQAAAIEETASALEEVSAMSRASAANAGNTKGSAEKASRLVREGSGDMTEMSAAMQKINQQADRISNIIKTIEEIAFQTNLLALNAAVEAARAGEAGKGFAVVADEVRNLSGRSAQAAKDTAELITATVESVRSGSTILERLSGGYGEIETSIGGIQSLIEQIASASNEQSQGVEQINTAIAQMNKVTQQNASGAEASAASAEDLEKQVADLRVNVGVLQAIVAGKKGRSAGSAKHALPRGNGRKALPLPAPSSSRGSAGGVVVMRPDMVLDEEV